MTKKGEKENDRKGCKKRSENKNSNPKKAKIKNRTLANEKRSNRDENRYKKITERKQKVIKRANDKPGESY